MLDRRVPEYLRHAPAPSVRGFAVLSAMDATARGMLISVFPLAVYRSLEDPAEVSEVYFLFGMISLAAGLLVPWLMRRVRRSAIFTMGAFLYVVSAVLIIAGGTNLAVPALLANMIATVAVFICLNAYVLDYVAKLQLGRCETLRLFYSALAWTLGPALGVALFDLWAPAPFLISGLAALTLIAIFWKMRLGDGKLITRAARPAPNPLAYLGRFAAQPRLIAGWLFATIRSCGWWVYVVYLPIFCVENGLGDQLGGIALSLTNSCLFLTPLMLKWVQRRSVRLAVRRGFLFSGLFFCAAALASEMPWTTVGLLMAGSFFLILLDISAGLPFLMAVKPSERSEMAAVYASYRDISGILSPGAAWLVLLATPISGVFTVAGLGLITAWGIASRLHPRLGAERVAVEAVAAKMATRAEAG